MWDLENEQTDQFPLYFGADYQRLSARCVFYESANGAQVQGETPRLQSISRKRTVDREKDREGERKGERVGGIVVGEKGGGPAKTLSSYVRGSWRICAAAATSWWGGLMRSHRVTHQRFLT